MMQQYRLALCVAVTLCGISSTLNGATLESVAVNIDDQGYFSSVGTFDPGEYTLTAVGEYIFDNSNTRYSDALFSYRDDNKSDPLLWTPLSFDRLVLVDGALTETAINWQGIANIDHIYTATVTHAGGAFNFRLFDGFYPDNESFGPFLIEIGESISQIPLSSYGFGLGLSVMSLVGFSRRNRHTSNT